jgi:multicomponent Na+:H+ antiporter subunit G
MRIVLADALVVVGLIVVTIGVYGVIRLPDVYTQLHASGKAAFLGIVLLLAAAGLQGDGPILTRVILITVLLADDVRGEEMRTPGAVDETASRRS